MNSLSPGSASSVIDVDPVWLDSSELIFLGMGILLTVILYFAWRYLLRPHLQADPLEKDRPEPILVEEKQESSLRKTFRGFFKSDIRPATFDEIEELLYTSDLSHETIQKLLKDLSDKSVASADFDQLKTKLRSQFLEILDVGNSSAAPEANDEPLFRRDFPHPFVMLIVGTNGAGKTTTIGKLSARFLKQDKRVLVVSSDTFRAAAHNQLKTWTERAQVEFFVSENSTDPSSVAFDGISKAKAGGYDIVLVDTVGRLHHQAHLMAELQKVTRVMQKVIPDAPHETILVVDGNTGQNGLVQAREFHKALKLTGVILTKLDGTAKGGIVLSICDEIKIPVYFLGVGEGIDDLIPFSSEQFLTSLLSEQVSH